LRLAGDAANGVLIPSSKIYVTDSLPDSDPQKPVLQAFLRDYQAKDGKLPATFAGNGYDAAMMIAEAIPTAGTDTAQIPDRLEGTRNHVGVTAVYSYSPDDHFGAQADSVVMLSVKDGKFALAQR